MLPVRRSLGRVIFLYLPLLISIFATFSIHSLQHCNNSSITEQLLTCNFWVIVDIRLATLLLELFLPHQQHLHCSKLAVVSVINTD